jgi:hypothetical protein
MAGKARPIPEGCTCGDKAAPFYGSVWRSGVRVQDILLRTCGRLHQRTPRLCSRFAASQHLAKVRSASAEPASASSAVLILNQKPIVRPGLSSERQLFPNSAVSFHRAEHFFASSCSVHPNFRICGVGAFACLARADDWQCQRSCSSCGTT